MAQNSTTAFAVGNVTKLVCELFHPFVREVGVLYCNTTQDEFSCWPATPEGTYATIPCPKDLEVVDPTKNATRFCGEDGVWAKRSNYNDCLTPHEKDHSADLSPESPGVLIIYNVGFIITTIALVAALIIFLYFRSLRCLRNVIHCHLIVTFILRHILWVIMHNALVDLAHVDTEWLCKLIVTVYNYLHGTNFFWMFVEGLYLFTIIVWAYSADKIRIGYYVIIGWVVPIIYTVVWAGVKSNLDDVYCWMPVTDTHYDYILHAPIFFVLVSNIFFLSAIIWVLITKLKASHNLETRQYRKAVKATIILFPLLGVTYVLFLIPPSDDLVVQLVFKYANALLQSFQGLFVAVFYCFLNGEVRAVLRKKFSNFQESRSIITRYTKTSYVGSPYRSSFHNNSTTTGVNGKSTSARGGKRFSVDSQQDEAENML